MQKKVMALCLRVQFFLANPVFLTKIMHFQPQINIFVSIEKCQENSQCMQLTKNSAAEISYRDW